MVPVPTTGRVFSASRRVRVGDVRADGTLRFDAVARYLQDFSWDDTNDAGLIEGIAWVVRRTAIELRRPAVTREMLTLRTFCSGVGNRWAERRVSMTGDAGASIEAVTLWVHMDFEAGRPKVLPDQFLEIYGEAIAGRRVTAGLVHDATVPTGALARPWVVRRTDLDPFDHVNNAATWEILEELIDDAIVTSEPLRAEIEYREPLLYGEDVVVSHRDLTPAEGTSGIVRALWVADGRSGEATVSTTGLVGPVDAVLSIS